jgi:hypothetical protein
MDNKALLVNAIGWTSSVILFLTIARQIYKQWHEGSSEGVSKWLFIGQVAASLGFAVYSWFLNNWVFVVTNLLMLLSAIVGLIISLKHKSRSTEAAGSNISKEKSEQSRPVHLIEGEMS